MTTRNLKWIGLGESEYVSKDGEFLVQLRDKLWHLHRRVAIEVDGLPIWTWSTSLFQAKRKGACQDEAENGPQGEAPDMNDIEPEPAPTHRAPARVRPEAHRPALDGYGHGNTEHTNATCWCCGVSFVRKAKWRFGDLCSMGCMDIMVDVLNECEALK